MHCLEGTLKFVYAFYVSLRTAFSTRSHVRQAMTQISLRKCTDYSVIVLRFMGSQISNLSLDGRQLFSLEHVDEQADISLRWYIYNNLKPIHTVYLIHSFSQTLFL